MREIHDAGMKILKDLPIPLADGRQVFGNLFLPEKTAGPIPLILNYSPYGKDVHFSDFLPTVWDELLSLLPQLRDSSSLRHMTFETPDPEIWTKAGYGVLRVDSIGSGKSPGILHPNSPQEFSDAAEVVEWAAAQDWSNGRVGLLGISYYAAGQWMIAQHRPKGLAAIQPWQGTSDFYRDRTRQGGQYSRGFIDFWWRGCVLDNQHGNGNSRYSDYFTGERNTGEALEPAVLQENRHEYPQDIRDHPLEDEWYLSRSADLSRIEVPTLVGANWGGLAAHLRGTLLGYEWIESGEKWLLIQRGNYFVTFYDPANVAIQKRFFDRFLKGDESAWADEPRVRVEVRAADDTIERTIEADEWPLPDRTEHVLHLDAADGSLSAAEPVQVAEGVASGTPVMFSTGPLDQPLEFVGTLQLTLRITAESQDVNVFTRVTAFRPDGTEAAFEAVSDPASPVSLGWLRASHRRIDPERSGFLRPFHTHDSFEPLTPGKEYDLQVEIWPTALALPAGYELRLEISNHDLASVPVYLHDDPERPADNRAFTILTGPGIDSRLSLPATHQTSQRRAHAEHISR